MLELSKDKGPEYHKNKELKDVSISLLLTLDSLPERGVELEPHQKIAIESIIDALEDGKTSGYIEMATSTGKTVVESLLAESAVNAGKRVLVLAPTIAIANQISGESNIRKTGISKFTNLHEDHQIHHHYGQRRTDENAQVVLSTYRSFLNEAKTGYQRLGDFDILIADECHRSLGKGTSKALLESYPGALKLGFSATPDYAVNRKSDQVYSECIYEYSLLEAIETGKTAPVRTLIYETDETLFLSDRQTDFTEQELEPLIKSMARNGVAAKLASDFIKDGRQGIIACISGQNNLHARFMADTLSRPEYSKIIAKDIGSHLSTEENALRLMDYEEGKIDILTFTRMIDEGWDSQKASFCINITPTTSPVRTKQLLGRILRKKEPDIDSIYVDFVDNQTGLAKQQYTAAHALDLEYIDMKRVLGQSQTSSGSYLQNHSYRLPKFSEEIYKQLENCNGKLLKDIFTEKTNYIDDTQYNDILPSNIVNKYHRAKESILESTGIEPSHSETVNAIEKIDKTSRRALGEYALRVPMHSVRFDTIADETVFGSDSMIDNEIAQIAMSESIEKVIPTLPDREQTIIRLRFGLCTPETINNIEEKLLKEGTTVDDKMQDVIDKMKSNEPLAFYEVGQIFKISGVRVRQIENRAFQRMRHPSRSKNIRNLL